MILTNSCDLLKNSYLCLLNNTTMKVYDISDMVVICWKIRIFAYWTTPETKWNRNGNLLWFAEKFVSLLIEQHPNEKGQERNLCCDLLKNSYLCLLNNTWSRKPEHGQIVVICWKIRIFAYWTTPKGRWWSCGIWLWFAEKFVSLLIEQHRLQKRVAETHVVICWKIRIFAYWTTPGRPNAGG